MTAPTASPWERTPAKTRKRIIWALWFVTWLGLLAGLFDRRFYVGVASFTVAHFLLMLGLNSFRIYAYPVQVRIVYVVWVIIGTWVPHMTVLMYIATVGLIGNLFFGYCTLARLMYLLPWNRDEPFSLGLVERVLSTPPTDGRFKPAPPPRVG